MDIYTPIDEAKKEIWRRWHDDALKKEIDRYLGDIPKVLSAEPRAVLARHVMGFDNEMIRFLELAQKVGLKPLGWEYLKDIFVTRNHDKEALAHISCSPIEKEPGVMVERSCTILDIEKADGKRFYKLKTFWGEKLSDFHHRLLAQNGIDLELDDASDWYMARSNGLGAKGYYQYAFALFLRNGVLFESFSSNEQENPFTEQVVFPAMEKVRSIFGLQPLVVPIIPSDELEDEYWWWYPDCIWREVSSILDLHRLSQKEAGRHQKKEHQKYA